MEQAFWPDPTLYDKPTCIESSTIDETRQMWQERAPELFLEGGKPYIEVAEAGHGRLDTCMLGSEKALDEYLTTERSCSRAASDTPCEGSHARIFLLRPSHGWGRLLLSQRSMIRILRHCGVFPPFLTYLTSFGEKEFARDEGFAGYDMVQTTCSAGLVRSLETCFLWKYVEADDGHARHKWTIRQQLIYQKYDVQNQKSTHIMVRIALRLAVTIKTAALLVSDEKRGICGDWTDIQMMCVTSGLEDWRSCINHLDSEASCLFDELILSSVNPDRLGEHDQVAHCLNTMKQLQILLDQMTRISQLLELNQATLRCMIEAILRHENSTAVGQRCQTRTQQVHQEYDFLLKMAKSVTERTRLLSNELRDTIALRNHEINHRAALLTGQGTHAMVNLSQKSAYEARVVKILTFIAIIFVPASFAADFLQMGYVSVSNARGFDVVASRDVWLWALLTFPLVVVTVLVYVVCEIMAKHKYRAIQSRATGLSV